MNDYYTEDLTKFGYRELDIAGDLLKAIKKGLPIDFDREGIKVGFNMNSGNVFLVNAEYQVAMVDDEGNLYSFYSSPYEGKKVLLKISKKNTTICTLKIKSGFKILQKLITRSYNE